MRNSILKLTIIIIAAAIGVVAMGELFLTPVNADFGPDAACLTWLYCTDCTLSCVISDPGGCGGSGLFYCATRSMDVYVEGTWVFGPQVNKYLCSTSPICSSTCW